MIDSGLPLSRSEYSRDVEAVCNTPASAGLLEVQTPDESLCGRLCLKYRLVAARVQRWLLPLILGRWLHSSSPHFCDAVSSLPANPACDMNAETPFDQHRDHSEPHAVAPAAFVQQFTLSQRPLYLFILGLTGSVQNAEEILQNTNLVIWRKASQFDLGSSFFAWACQIARYEVLQHRQRYRRDRLKFSDEFIDVVSRDESDVLTEQEPHRKALELCIQKLAPRDQELIRERYRPGGSGKDLAAELGRPQNSVYQSLGRIRRVLLECIQRRLAEM